MSTRWSIQTLSQWRVVRGCDWAFPVLMAEVSSPPSHSPREGGGMLAFTLLGKVLLGQFPPFLRACQDLLWVSTSGSQHTEFIAWLNGPTAGGQGRALCLVLCWHHSCVSMASSGCPRHRRGRRRPAEKGQLGQHPAQNMPPSQGGSRQVGYLASVLGWWAAMAQAFLLIKEMASHAIEIHIAAKLRCLWEGTGFVTPCCWFNRK